MTHGADEVGAIGRWMSGDGCGQTAQAAVVDRGRSRLVMSGGRGRGQSRDGQQGWWRGR